MHSDINLYAVVIQYILTCTVFGFSLIRRNSCFLHQTHSMRGIALGSVCVCGMMSVSANSMRGIALGSVCVYGMMSVSALLPS